MLEASTLLRFLWSRFWSNTSLLVTYWHWRLCFGQYTFHFTKMVQRTFLLILNSCSRLLLFVTILPKYLNCSVHWISWAPSRKLHGPGKGILHTPRFANVKPKNYLLNCRSYFFQQKMLIVKVSSRRMHDNIGKLWVFGVISFIFITSIISNSPQGTFQSNKAWGGETLHWRTFRPNVLWSSLLTNSTMSEVGPSNIFVILLHSNLR